jgi:hypothetical protein
MSLVQRKINSPEHTYINARIDNIYAGDETPKRATLTQKYSALIDKQSDYEMAVTFWNLKGELPIFICPIVEGITQNNIDLTPFGVCFSYAGNDYSAPVIYQSFSSVYGVNVPFPKPPSKNGGIQDLQTNAYYTVYAYKDFLDMVNSAIVTAFVAFKVAHPTSPNSNVPQFVFDPATKLISLLCDFTFSQPGTAYFHMNDLLLNYFAGLQVEFNGYNQPNFKDYTFIIEQGAYNTNAFAVPGDVIPTPPLLPEVLKITQDYNALYLWSNIRSVIFTSSTILSRDEVMPPVLNPNSQFAQNLNKFNPTSTNIISYYDLIEDANSTATARQFIYYNPPIYKWIDLMGDTPLQTIQLDVYIQTTNGQLLPLFIPSNQCIDIKFLFRKKNI